eukprot:6044674-Pleurochrysis_carterae.AAC.1
MAGAWQLLYTCATARPACAISKAHIASDLSRHAAHAYFAPAAASSTCARPRSLARAALARPAARAPRRPRATSPPT